jgi:membrane-bound lytic murein transglycosylase D
MNRTRITTLLVAALATLTMMAAQKNSILSIKQTITDDNIVFPESFETDTHELMTNWYLQNYTILDADVEKRSTGEVSEQEYIKRLAALPTEIEMPYNQVVRSYIDRYIKRNRTLVEEMLGMSLYYMPIFEQALEQEQLPLELKYLPVIESALNPNAVSRAGAAGLWQFMVGTGKGLGLEVNSLVDERRDPYRSSTMAATYLKNLFSIYNDWSLAIAAYNCGPGNVNKALRRAGGEGADFWAIYPDLPRETRGYVPAFIAANYVMTYFKQHNISPTLARKPLITDTVGVTRRIHFNQIAAVLNMPVEELRALNPQYRRDVIPGDSEHCYTLVLPSQQVYSYIMSEDSIANYDRKLYAHREVVEPTETTVSQTESRPYTWETKTVTSWHKVRKGENATTIAKRYGMSTSQLASLNGLKRGRVQRGQSLKVTTTKRVKVYHDAEPTSGEGKQASASGDNDEGEDDNSEDEQIAEVKRVQQEAKQAETTKRAERAERERQQARRAEERKTTPRETGYKNRQQASASHSKHEKTPRTTSHTVKKGESWSRIADRAGISVTELKKANPSIKGDKLPMGVTLKVPGKGGKQASAKAGRGSSKVSRGKSARGNKAPAKSATKKRKRR